MLPKLTGVFLTCCLQVWLFKNIFRCIKHVEIELLKQRSRRALESFFLFSVLLCAGVLS